MPSEDKQKKAASKTTSNVPTEQFGMVKGDAEYKPEDLQHLSDLEHVRERPSMYIGDTTVRGLHHLVFEVVDNSIDEAMAGYAVTVRVQVNNDGSITVEDDGRGIPIGNHEQLSEELGRDETAAPGNGAERRNL